MMKAYPEYKNTGLEWLGDIPSHWLQTKNKFLAKYTKGKNPSELHDEKAPSFYPYLAMDFLRGRNNSPKYACLNSSSYLVKEGQNLIIWDGSNAGEFVIGKEGILSSTMAAAELTTKVKPRFYKYLAILIEKEMRRLTVGMGIPHVDGSELNNLTLPLPECFREQEKISDYLDEHVGRVDKLIAEKQSFIKLLQEKRQALISHVVTKGLDDNVKMKPSGVEWLGEIPEHWELTKLRYLGICQNGINIDGSSFGSGFPFVSYGDVYKNRVLPSSVKGLVQSTQNDRLNYNVKSGDIFFTRTSETIEEIGFASVSKQDIPNAVFAGFLIRFRPLNKNLSENYAEFYFSNEKLRAFFVKEMNLVTRASLSQELLKKMPVAFPPYDEQVEIAEYLGNRTAKFDEIIKETKDSIDLLKEHRTALISAAVTGKIDIREEV